jgi:hypothetical protein
MNSQRKVSPILVNDTKAPEMTILELSDGIEDKIDLAKKPMLPRFFMITILKKGVYNVGCMPHSN